MILGVPWRRFLRDLYREVQEHHLSNGAAALGFWLTLAVFPAMIFVMAIIPYLPVAQVDVAIMDLLRQVLPQSAADLFPGVVADVVRQQRGGILSFGALATLWAASSGMYAIMQELNITYEVREGRNFLRARGTALGLSILFAVLVVGAFSLVVAGGLLQEWIGRRVGFEVGLLVFFEAFRWVMILVALLLGFALVYYLGPDVKQRFAFITPGSVLGALLLVAASLGFKFYVANFGNYNATYGSIGAVIILMFWLYIAGLVMLLGSEVNALIEHYAPNGKEKGERAPARPGSGNSNPML
ncbi:MAG: hypothetical protein H6R10_1519 [Rhodocyclaceae bacterium]|nr:hypothetical protein [Rhodocyclaceae bacterium]